MLSYGCLVRMFATEICRWFGWRRVCSCVGDLCLRFVSETCVWKVGELRRERDKRQQKIEILRASDKRRNFKFREEEECEIKNVNEKCWKLTISWAMRIVWSIKNCIVRVKSIVYSFILSIRGLPSPYKQKTIRIKKQLISKFLTQLGCEKTSRTTSRKSYLAVQIQINTVLRFRSSSDLDQQNLIPENKFYIAVLFFSSTCLLFNNHVSGLVLL